MLFELTSASFNKRHGNIDDWKSTGIHDDGTNITSVSNSGSAVPRLLNQNYRVGVTFAGNYMKQRKVAYVHGAGINIYIVYKLQKRTNNSDMTLESCLFGGVKLTKDVNVNHYKYSGYGIGFDSGSIENINSGIKCYCKENNKKHQHFWKTIRS